MTNKEKRLLFVKKQEKRIAKKQKQEIEDLKDKKFIIKKTGLTKDKSNQKLKDLHNMKKTSLTISARLAKRTNDETKAVIVENITKAIENNKNKALNVDNANTTLQAINERNERLSVNLKVFGLDCASVESVILENDKTLDMINALPLENSQYDIALATKDIINGEFSEDKNYMFETSESVESVEKTENKKTKKEKTENK